MGARGPSHLFRLGIRVARHVPGAEYWSAAIPALAAFAGLAIACIRPAAAQRIIVAAVAIVVTLSITGSLKFGEEWRAAADFVRPRTVATTPVLLRAGFIESDQPDWLRDPARRGFLLAPAAAYDFGGELVPMPYLLDEDGEAYLEDLVSERLEGADRFLFVARDRDTHEEAWLDGRLDEAGFVSQEIGMFGAVYVVEFTRDDAP